MTYTFKLRSGLKFHNGRALTSADVKYSIERAVNPKTQCPGAGYFGTIKGYDDVAAGKTTSLAGLATPDDSTVVFTLTRPDATFLHIMAINFAFIVPKEEVEKYGADFGHHPVGTGAFKFVEWQAGPEARARAQQGLPHPGRALSRQDHVRVRPGSDGRRAASEEGRGRHLLGDGIPPAQFLQVTSDPANKDLWVAGAQMNTDYVTMNVKVKPFDNLKVRQAVNMAINKDRVIQIINGRAKVANQVLPPSLPGYDTAHQGYPYDPAKAQEPCWRKQDFPMASRPRSIRSTSIRSPRIAQAIQQDLAGIGIKADIKSLAGAAVIEAGGTEGQAPMIWSGGMAWIADFPDPSDFYTVILGCAGAVEGRLELVLVLQPGSRQARRTRPIPWSAADQMAAGRCLEGIFNDVMKDAPWVPVMNEQRFTMHSARLMAAIPACSSSRSIFR